MMMVYPTEEGEYEVMEEIGRGASALVHRALCIPLNQIVAIKCLDLETIHCTLEDIRREAQLMSLIDHENVIRAYCSFVVDHYLWVVMPYMEGGSCMHIMKVSHPDGFEEQIIATILKEALKALSYLHQQGHIHRDVKAGNILIDANGGVKLGDFGVSACMFDGGDRTYSRNTFVGTPCWMAPEVMEQKQGYDFRADIWSFGITALELAHGHAPFQKYPPMKVLLMTIQNAPPSLDYERDKRFSKAFREMISLCLQKDPNKRPTAEKLLKHSFFKQAKSGQFLVQNILHGLTPLWEREKVLRENDAARLAQKETPYLEQEEASQIVYKRGVSSWSFDVESLMISNELDDSELTCDKEHDHPWPSVSRQNDDSSMSSQNSSSVQLENLSSTSLTGVARSSVEKDNSTDSKFFDKNKLIENVDTDTKCAQQRVSSIVPPLSVFRNQGRDRWSFEKREPKQVGRFGVFDGDLDLESPGWQEITRRREVIQKEREKQMGTDPLNENEGNQNQKATTKPCGLQPANTALQFVDKESKSSRESFEGIREYNAGDTKNTDSTLSMNDEEDFLGPNLKSIEMQENNLSSFAQNYNIEDDSQPPSISGSVSNENERIAALVPQLQALIHQTSQQHGCLSNMLRSILPNSSSHGSNLTTKSLQHGGADEQVIRLMQREQELMLEVSSIKRKMEILMEELETLKLKNHQLENEVNTSNAN